MSCKENEMKMGKNSRRIRERALKQNKMEHFRRVAGSNLAAT